MVMGSDDVVKLTSTLHIVLTTGQFIKVSVFSGQIRRYKQLGEVATRCTIVIVAHSYRVMGYHSMAVGRDDVVNLTSTLHIVLTAGQFIKAFIFSDQIRRYN